MNKSEWQYLEDIAQTLRLLQANSHRQTFEVINLGMKMLWLE